MAPFVKLFDALNTPESLFIFHGTGREIDWKGWVYPEYPDRIQAAALGKNGGKVEKFLGKCGLLAESKKMDGYCIHLECVYIKFLVIRSTNVRQSEQIIFDAMS